MVAALTYGLLLCPGVSAGHGAGDWPAAVGPPQAGHVALRRLVNAGFTIGYDAHRERAAWVAYHLHPMATFVYRPRPSYRPDPRLGGKPVAGIYAAPEYDRGHLAPNHAISQLYGKRAQRQTFYHSNITPQRGRLNQLLWQRLEEIEFDVIAPRVGTLWVVLGPVPAPSGGPPSGFFRIWLARADDGPWRALAFRLPQRVRGDERLDRFQVSVDAIEAATGLDFFGRLDTNGQAALEGAVAPATTFGFAAFACLPARYSERWQGRDGVHLRYARCDGRDR